MFGNKMMFLPILISLLSQNVMAGAIMDIASTDRLPFHEITLDTEGIYDLDVDFDGINERIIADEYSNVTVLKRNILGEQVDITQEMPYSLIRIHRCCDAHRAYTTINFSQHTIYAEAHYGYSEYNIRKFRKIDDSWLEIYPIKPLSLLIENMFPKKPVGWVYYGSHMVWRWSYYYKHR